ncbi:MAG: DUF2807 domain-containing protein [Chitinophagaceae bacterium]|nr:DUF2807 domain-containing protein [Chitinophagaceae bacterium]
MILLTSCSKDVLRGKGPQGTRQLTLPAFTQVESHYDIAADISYGATQQVEVTGYENLLKELNITVEQGILKLKFDTRYERVTNGNVVVKIKVPALAKASIHGSRDINISGFANGATLQARIHGSGSIRIANSSYQKAVLDVYGSGQIAGQGLQVSEAEANVFGSGHSSISVSQRLKVTVNGSGNVYYWGNPQLETTYNGSGRAIKQ